MRRYSRILMLLPVVVLLTAAWSCNQATSQKVLNKVAVADKAFTDSVITLHTSGDLTDDQERQFLGWSRRIAETGNAASAAFLAGDNATALAQINLGIGVVDDALNNGLLGIKNPDKRTAVNATLLTLRGLFTTAASFLPQTTKGATLWQPQLSPSFA